MHYWRGLAFDTDPKRVCFRCKHTKSEHRKNGQCYVRVSNGFWGAARGKRLFVRQRVETRPCSCFHFVPTKLVRRPMYYNIRGRMLPTPDIGGAFNRPKHRNDNHRQSVTG